MFRGMFCFLCENSKSNSVTQNLSLSNFNKVIHWIDLISCALLVRVLSYFRSLNLVTCEDFLYQLTDGRGLYFKHNS